MVKAAAQVTTARLILRQPRMSDAASIFERYASDPEVTRFLGWPRHRSIGETEAFLEFSEREWERWPAGPYLVLSRLNGLLLGATGLAFQEPHEAVTGYVLARDAWGNGYATEALTAVVEVASGAGVKALRALCHPEHRTSQRVLEKCGFIRDDTSARQLEFPNLSPGQQAALCYALVLASATKHAI